MELKDVSWGKIFGQ